MYQELYFLKFILKVKSLVNKSVNEITDLKFIGVFLCFARGARWGIFIDSIKSCISKINTGTPSVGPRPPANPG